MFLGNDAAIYGPGLAIDGLFHDSHIQHGFYHPLHASNAEWLQINMGREETLCKVHLYARTDYEYGWGTVRRENIEVRVGNIQASSDITGNPLCGTTKPHPTSYQTTLRCVTPLTGMLIILRHSTNEFWSVDELFAFSI